MSDKGAFQFTTGDLMKMGIYFGQTLHEYFLTVSNNDDLDDANQNLSCKANRLKDEMIKGFLTNEIDVNPEDRYCFLNKELIWHYQRRWSTKKVCDQEEKQKDGYKKEACKRAFPTRVSLQGFTNKEGSNEGPSTTQEGTF
jgi:hypothetical protein